jgi:hypothetical protein
MCADGPAVVVSHLSWRSCQGARPRGGTRRLTRLRHLSVEALQNGQLLLGRSGTVRGLGASLNLLPEHNAAYLFPFNAECYLTSACQIVPEFREQLLERFLC